MRVMQTREFCDNPKVPVMKSIAMREPNFEDLEQARESLTLNFDTFEEFVEHNSDLTITKKEFAAMWNEYNDEYAEEGNWWPSPEEVYGASNLI